MGLLSMSASVLIGEACQKNRTEVVSRSRPSARNLRARSGSLQVAKSARRTFFNPRCTPLKLPADKYEVWKDLDVNFDPKDVL